MASSSEWRSSSILPAASSSATFASLRRSRSAVVAKSSFSRNGRRIRSSSSSGVRPRLSLPSRTIEYPASLTPIRSSPSSRASAIVRSLVIS